MSGAVLPMSRDIGLTLEEKELALGCLNFAGAVGGLGGGERVEWAVVLVCEKFVSQFGARVPKFFTT